MPDEPKVRLESKTRRVGVESMSGGWALLFEWPYCSTCGTYTWEHKHAGKTAGPTMFRTRDDELLAALGLAGRPPLTDVRSAFRALMKVHHPDVGGDPETAKRLIAAYDELRARGLAP